MKVDPGQLRTWEIVHVAGVNDALIMGATPVPERATGEPATGTFAVIVTVPAAGPKAVGENTTLIVQVLPATKLTPQVPPAAALANGAVTVMLIPVSVALPVLCSTSCRDALVVPTGTFPNASGPPVTLAMAAGVATNSTAPMSNAGPCGLVRPKKSVRDATKPPAEAGGMASVAGEPAA